HMIFNYRIVPAPVINIMALTMPWLELLCGLALIIGVWRRAALMLIGAMLIVFITAIGINVGRGNAIDCGCFNVGDAGKTYQQRMFDMKLDVWRDLGMLLMVAQVWMADKKARTGSSPSYIWHMRPAAKCRTGFSPSQVA